MSVREDRLKDILSNVAKNSNLKRWRYNISQESMKGIENYFGVLVPAIMTGNKGTDTTEDSVTLHLLIKFTPNNIEERMKLLLKYMFEVEAFFYSVLRPMFSDIISQVSIDNNLIPNFYYADIEPDKQVIVLQDMTFEDFRMHTDQRFFNFDHLVVALKALAKFHALSVLSQEKVDILEDTNILAPYTDTHPVELNATLKLALKNHHKYFRSTRYEKYLKGLISRYSSIRLDSFEKARRLVCGHGDYWKGNILFKYKENKPDQACIVDFQTLHFLSPAQDFLSFIIVSSDAKTRLNHYEELLIVYLETISETLAKTNEKLKNSYIDDFKSDLSVVAENCLVTSFMAFALWYGLEEDTLVKSINKTDKSGAIHQFTETVTNIIDDLEKFGYITLY